MATLTHRISVFSDGSYTISGPSDSTRQYFRVPHDTERVNVNADDYRYRPNVGMTGRGPVRQIVLDVQKARPEVFRVNDDAVPLTDPYMWLWRWINSGLSGDKFCTILGNTLAWTNNTGFPGRRNIILNKDLALKYPAFHAVILCGGAIVEGVEVEGRVYFRSILKTEPIPTAGAVLSDPYSWYWGTSINPRGEINLTMKLGLEGKYVPYRIPIVTDAPAWLPADQLHKLPVGAPIPSPLWLST